MEHAVRPIEPGDQRHGLSPTIGIQAALLVLSLGVGCQKREPPTVASHGSHELVTLPNSTVAQANEGKVSGIDPEGKVKWTATLPAPEVVLGRPAAAPDSTIYLRTSSALRALSPNGQWLWKIPLPAPRGEPLPYSPAAMTDSSSVVLVEGQTYRAYSRQGEGRWEISLDSSERPHAAPQVAPDGQIYVSTDQSLYSISPDGRVTWRQSR